MAGPIVLPERTTKSVEGAAALQRDNAALRTEAEMLRVDNRRLTELLRSRDELIEQLQGKVSAQVGQLTGYSRGDEARALARIRPVVELARNDATVRVVSSQNRSRACAVQRCAADGKLTVLRGYYGDDTTFAGWVGQHMWPVMLKGMFVKGTASVLGVDAAGAPADVGLEEWLGSCSEGDAAPEWPPSARTS